MQTSIRFSYLPKRDIVPEGYRFQLTKDIQAALKASRISLYIHVLDIQEHGFKTEHITNNPSKHIVTSDEDNKQTKISHPLPLLFGEI